MAHLLVGGGGVAGVMGGGALPPPLPPRAKLLSFFISMQVEARYYAEAEQAEQERRKVRIPGCRGVAACVCVCVRVLGEGGRGGRWCDPQPPCHDSMPCPESRRRSMAMGLELPMGPELATRAPRSCGPRLQAQAAMRLRAWHAVMAGRCGDHTVCRM